MPCFIRFWLLVVSACLLFVGGRLRAAEPIPKGLIVMTFDDSVKSHFTVARPVLKKYGFGATFFITEGFTFKSNKTDYMTWEEIQTLHRDGFEIGNHTRDHMGVSPSNVDQLEEQLKGIDDQCRAMNIPRTVSFAWPGNAICREALPVLEKYGIRYARRGGNPELKQWSGRGYAYEPGKDHHFLIPSAAVPLPKWTFDDMVAAAFQARDGRIAVFQFHGVPEGEHPFVNTPRPVFERFLQYLHDHKFKVIALKDIERYVDTKNAPHDPWAIIDQRIGKKGPDKKPDRSKD
jgi:peptidoglycan/xylan/chitin deacetylase (PgdA/CDA1 family)